MSRAIISLAAIVFLLVSANPVDAQGISVVKKPAPAVGPDEFVVYDHWVSSWGLRDDPPDSYPLGITGHSTQAAAVAAAKAHMAQTAGNGAYAVTHYLIEGEPSVRSKKGPSLPSDKRVQDDTISSLRDDLKQSVLGTLKEDVENIFKKKNQEVEDAYRRAKEAKEVLTKNVKRIADDDFKKANGLASEYNNLKDKYSREKEHPEYFVALPRMTPVNADALRRKQDKWKRSQQSRDNLEKEKQALDAEKARLDADREQIIENSKSLDQEASSIGDTSGLAGSSWKNSNSSDLFGLRFIDFDDGGALIARYNVEATRFNGKWRSLGGDSFEITLRGGTYTVTINGSEFNVSNVTMLKTKDGTPDPTALAKRRAVAEKQQERASKVAQYRRDLQSYQQHLADYKQGLSAHNSHANDWGEDQYAGGSHASP
jgi:hypothetical protein